jgi:hypothetical protein
MKLTLPKLGTWSPLGLPKTQSLIAGVKTPCIGVFLISLERSWSVDVQNGLAWVIWTSAAQVMGKRWARSQTGSLTPDHYKSGIDPIPTCDGGVRHGIEKALEESYKIGSYLVPIGGESKKLWWPKVPGVLTGIVSGLHFGSPGTKSNLGRGRGGATQRIPYGGRWWLSSSPGRGESSESNVARGLSQHQKGAEWVLTNLWLVLDAGLCNKIIVPLPSLIPKLLACPSYPL